MTPLDFVFQSRNLRAQGVSDSQRLALYILGYLSMRLH